MWSTWYKPQNRWARSDFGCSATGVSLLSTTFKILYKNILWRFQSVCRRNCWDHICEFRCTNSTTDQIFSIRQILMKNVKIMRKHCSCLQAYSTPIIWLWERICVKFSIVVVSPQIKTRLITMSLVVSYSKVKISFPEKHIMGAAYFFLPLFEHHALRLEDLCRAVKQFWWPNPLKGPSDVLFLGRSRKFAKPRKTRDEFTLKVWHM